MKPGHASRTAVMVCMARAAAHGRTTVARFSDPTAMVLLPNAARGRVERFRAELPPQSMRERLGRVSLERRSHAMVARTVEIDDAVRKTDAPQVVILGAGLDGRAWRMPELHDAVVFEVDHPDSQRDKRARVSGLTQTAREVRFVAVDFTRDDLDAALSAAGHDPTRPTTWVWEGVVMYLTREAIESTLAIVSRRSTAGSHLVVMYHRPSVLALAVGLFVRMLGEPFRSSFTPEAMRALLHRYGFEIERDEGLATIGAALSPEVARAVRPITHLRFATAVRAT